MRGAQRRFQVTGCAFLALTNHTAVTLAPYAILTAFSLPPFHLNHKNLCPTLLISEQRRKRRAPDTQSATRDTLRKKGGRFFLRSKKILKPSHSANMREFRPMPTTSKAMRHFEKADKRGDRKAPQTLSFSQTVSLPQKTENHHPSSSLSMLQKPTARHAKRHERHIEKKEGRFFEEEKDSQTVSFHEHAGVPSHAHHTQGRETL